MLSKKFLLAALIVFICAGMLWAGGKKEEPAAAAAAVEAAGTELPQIWTTPAAYEQATGKKIGAYKQSSYLDKAVASGELPPVEDRLPAEPMVVLGCEGIGKYGGAFILPAKTAINALMPYEQGQLTWQKHTFMENYPNLIKGLVQVDNEGKVWELRLRRGLKWSDGYPFTADDIMFYINDVAGDTTGLTRAKPHPGFDGIKAIKVDEYTIRITFTNPTSAVGVSMTGSLSYFGSKFPFHYLKQFHPKYIGAEEYKKQVKEGKFERPEEYWNHVSDRYHRNPNKPTTDAWIRVTYKEDVGIIICKRNPYYFAVDPEGNQLPYFDEYHFVMTGGDDVSLLRAMNGDVSWFTTGLDDYVVAKKAEQDGKCRVVPWNKSAMNVADLEFNVTHEDPVLRKLFKDITFKTGVSHALNRPQYNELIYFGLSEPWQVAPCETDPFYHERAAHVALDYDPEKASRLLDKAGLDKKDSDGWRLLPDGKLLDITVLYSINPHQDSFAIAEMMVEDLNKAGIKSTFKALEYKTAWSIRNANEHDAYILHWSWGTNNGTLGGLWDQNMFELGSSKNAWARKWNDWWTSKGEKGEKPDQIMLDVMEWSAKSKATTDIEEQKQYWKKILDVYADNLWGIGTLKYPGDLLILAPYMRNVPNTKLALTRGDWGRQDVMYSDQQ